MSDGSQFTNSRTRPLRTEELALIHSLVSAVYEREDLDSVLASSQVTDMQDGGMGGVRFVGPEPRSFGKVLAEAQYVDSDGVLVTIAINVDSNGHLFEVDFWKVDFSSIRSYPRPSDLIEKPI